MLSNTCKYAIRAVLYLAINEKENTKIGIKKISVENGTYHHKDFIPLQVLGM